MVGTRNIAFPRLNAFSYWIYLFGGIFLWVAFLLNSGPDVGWFAYVPLTDPQFSPGKRPDVWAQMITFTEVSALAVSVEIIVTVFKQRAPGMALNPAALRLGDADYLLPGIVCHAGHNAGLHGADTRSPDRHPFFRSGRGGNVLLWQHLFWFFGHPEVYIIFIRAPVWCRRLLPRLPPASVRLSGDRAVIDCDRFSRLRPLGTSHVRYRGAAAGGRVLHRLKHDDRRAERHSDLLLAGDVVGRQVGLRTPPLFVFGFIVIFVLGGLTGVMVASVPLDLQVHDTYFVVAHFHYVLIGGAVFPLIGGVYYWFPKITAG